MTDILSHSAFVGSVKFNGDGLVRVAIEQNIVNVNQIMQFGKLLVIFQAHPADPSRTMVSAFIVLGVESDLEIAAPWNLSGNLTDSPE